MRLLIRDLLRGKRARDEGRGGGKKTGNEEMRKGGVENSDDIYSREEYLLSNFPYDELYPGIHKAARVT